MAIIHLQEVPIEIPLVCDITYMCSIHHTIMVVPAPAYTEKNTIYYKVQSTFVKTFFSDPANFNYNCIQLTH